MKKFTDVVEPFSIDEQFMDVTGSQRLFGDPFQIAQKVQSEILRGTGIYARCGIGPNKVLLVKIFLKRMIMAFLDLMRRIWKKNYGHCLLGNYSG